jgi:thioredoxin-like negative regulator of GroEL
MMHMILGRLLLSVVMSATFAAAALAFIAGNRKWLRSRLKKSQHTGVIDSAAPTILYFWSANCAQCKPQERQIEQARDELARSGRVLEVRKVNALEERELAKAMNVMTVPTTVLIDAERNIVAWNPGLTRTEKIVNHFETISGSHTMSAPKGGHQHRYVPEEARASRV